MCQKSVVTTCKVIWVIHVGFGLLVRRGWPHANMLILPSKTVIITWITALCFWSLFMSLDYTRTHSWLDLDPAWTQTWLGFKAWCKIAASPQNSYSEMNFSQCWWYGDIYIYIYLEGAVRWSQAEALTGFPKFYLSAQFLISATRGPLTVMTTVRASIFWLNLQHSRWKSIQLRQKFEQLGNVLLVF